jgi:hypothetical protein
MYYRLINIKTGKAMKLANNSQNIEEVREDLLIYLSLEQDETVFTNKTLEDMLVEANIRLDSSDIPFDEESPIAEYLVIPLEEKPAYKPTGRVAHVSNYYN